MLWLEYWQYQEKLLHEQILTIKAELNGLPNGPIQLRNFERAASRKLRRYLKRAVRRETWRIVWQHRDGFLRSVGIAHKLRLFVLHHCRVRMQIRVGSSGNERYPELAYSIPSLHAEHYQTCIADIDRERTQNLEPFLAFDCGSNFGTMWIYPAQGIMPAYTQVLSHLPNFRKDGKPCNSGGIYPAVLAEVSAWLKPAMEQFRQMVQAEERCLELNRKLRFLTGRQQQQQSSQAIWDEIVLPESQKLVLIKQVDLLLDGRMSCPQAVLFKGPPGTGKTMLASKLAKILGSHFHRATLSDLKHPHLGRSGQLVAELWAKLRASKPAVLFLDECDSIFAKRGAAETDAVALEVVQAFLAQWDGKEAGIWILGATNRRDRIDDAILSRFGMEMEIALPDQQARYEILRRELSTLQYQGNIPAQVAESTIGMSGRNLAMLAGKVFAAAYPGEIAVHHFQSAIQTMRVAGNTSVDEEATWKTLVLDEETEQKLKTLCSLLKNVEAWKAQGVSIPTGVLLVGPPGTGKTQIARTLANESGLSFIGASTADIKANFLGQSANRVQQIFARARAAAPGILFLDELGVLARDRTVSGSDALLQEIIGQLLQEMDGIQTSKAHVFLLAATNHADQVDTAILSRLQQQIEIPLPDIKARIRLLSIYLREKRLALQLTDACNKLAEVSTGMSGRDIKNWIARAEQKAVERAIAQGGPEHFLLEFEDFTSIHASCR